jgi:hypothetical protein
MGAIVCSISSLAAEQIGSTQSGIGLWIPTLQP